MLKFSEIFEFSKEKFRKIPILKEFEWFEWFEWFGPSPIEPFNSGLGLRELLLDLRLGRHGALQARLDLRDLLLQPRQALIELFDVRLAVAQIFLRHVLILVAVGLDLRSWIR